MGDVLDTISSFAAPLAGAALGSVVPGIGTAFGAALGSGLQAGISSGNPVSGLLAGGGSLLGGELLGGATGGLFGETPANALGGAFGGDTVGSFAPLGSFAGNVLGSSTLGSIAGSSLGSSFGSQLGDKLNPQTPDSSASGPAAFQATRSPQMGLPQSLSQFGGLDPFQQATNIAAKGMYGAGNGSNENSYFLNLINRQLVDDGGNVGGMDKLNPAESGYLSQIGLGGYNNSNDLLKGISQYQG
jgi:hypothetical protein